MTSLVIFSRLSASESSRSVISVCCNSPSGQVSKPAWGVAILRGPQLTRSEADRHRRSFRFEALHCNSAVTRVRA
jgi:hypothetical protein